MQVKAKSIRVEIGQVPKQKKKDVVYFSSFEEMNKVLTPNRIELLEIIRTKKPESIYQLAQFAGKDQGNVTKDVNVLEEHGFLEIIKTKEGNRMKSEPRSDYNMIEMAIKLGAGAFGVAKETLDTLSTEFEGENLKENTDFVKKKYGSIVEPVRKSVKKSVKELAEQFDIAIKDEK